MRRAAAVLLLMSVAGCGAVSPTATREQVQAQADALCDAAFRELGPAISGSRTDGSEGPQATAAELDDLAGRERRLAQQAEDLASGAEELDGPPDDTAALDAAAAELREATARLREAAEAAEGEQRVAHDGAQRAAYEAYVRAVARYEGRFARRCGTVGGD